MSSIKGPASFKLLLSIQSVPCVRFGFSLFIIFLNCTNSISFSLNGGIGLFRLFNHFSSLDDGGITGGWLVFCLRRSTFCLKKLLNAWAIFSGLVTCCTSPFVFWTLMEVGDVLLLIPSKTLAVFQAFDQSQHSTKSLLK